MITPDETLSGWIPRRLCWDDIEPQVEWCWRGDARFTQPFFDETLSGIIYKNREAKPSVPTVFTPLETLYEVESKRAGLLPSGLIFHISRCGSTVIARTLAGLPEHLVFSEPPFLDEILRIERQLPGITDGEKLRLLRAALNALARPLVPESRLYIKLDCWHLLNAKLIRKAFPNTPTIFLYRDPVEVTVSLVRQTSTTLLPGTIPPELLSLKYEDAWLLPKPEYVARILALFLQIGLEQQDQWELVNYSELPDYLWSQLSEYFGYTFSQTDQALIQDLLSVHAKRPTNLYFDDRAEKQATASPVIHQQCDLWTTHLYQMIEQARLQNRAERRVDQHKTSGANDVHAS